MQGPPYRSKRSYHLGGESPDPIDPIHEYRDVRGGRHSRVFAHHNPYAFESRDKRFEPETRRSHFWIVGLLVLVTLLIAAIAGSMVYIFGEYTHD